MYSRQLMAIEDMVVMIPGMVQHQPTVSMTDDGHNTSRRRVLIPRFQRRYRIAPDVTNPITPATNAVFLTVIAIINLRQKLQSEQRGKARRWFTAY
jgi:hypothetical protein